MKHGINVEASRINIGCTFSDLGRRPERPGINCLVSPPASEGSAINVMGLGVATIEIDVVSP